MKIKETLKMRTVIIKDAKGQILLKLKCEKNYIDCVKHSSVYATKIVCVLDNNEKIYFNL